jgi:hypothetical protein
MNQAAITANVPRWTYSDSNPKEAMALAFTPGFGPTPAARLRGLRTLMVTTAWLIDELQLDPSSMKRTTEGEAPGPAPKPAPKPAPDAPRVFGLNPKPVFTTTEYANVAATLARTFQLLPPAGNYTLYSVETHDGDAPVVFDKGGAPKREVKLPNDTGWVIPAGVLVIAGISALVLGMIAIADQYQPTVEKWLLERETTKRLLQTHQAAAQVVADHIERDKKSGTVTPFLPQENVLINGVKASQDALLEQERKIAPPAPPRPPGFLEGLDKLVDSLPYIAAAGVVGYAITR